MIYQSTIYYYLRGRKLYCRVNCNNKNKTRSIGQSVREKYWNQNQQRVKKSHPQSVEINNNLSALETEIRHAEGVLNKRDKTATPKRIFTILDGTEDKTTILKLFNGHNRKVKQRVGNDYVKATYTKFKTIKKQVTKAIKDITGNDDMYANDIDIQFIENLEHWWKTEQGLSHNTMCKYMSFFNKIILIGVKKGCITKNPMDEWDVKPKKKVPTFLTLDELERLRDRNFEIERLAKVRNAFLFQCYTGLAYSDLTSLNRRDDFYRDEEGDLWLTQVRKKTGQPFNVLVLPQAEKIYNQYDYLNSPVPVLSNQKSNAYLKEIAVLCRINKKLTTHVARHTFATTVALGNGVPIETVQALLGHKDRRSTEHYARITNSKLQREMKDLRNKLS